MTPGEQALERVGESLRELRLAANLWNAVDLSRIDQCRETLESAIGNMVEAEKALQLAPGAAPADLRPRLLELKSEALRIERLVDASSAFLRGAFPHIGAGSPVYQSGGHIRVEPAPAASSGVQG